MSIGFSSLHVSFIPSRGWLYHVAGNSRASYPVLHHKKGKLFSFVISSSQCLVEEPINLVSMKGSPGKRAKVL